MSIFDNNPYEILQDILIPLKKARIVVVADVTNYRRIASVCQPIYNTPVKLLNTLKPRQNGRHFPDDIFKRIFFNENIRISIKISLKFVPKGPNNNIPAIGLAPTRRQDIIWNNDG